MQIVVDFFSFFCERENFLLPLYLALSARLREEGDEGEHAHEGGEGGGGEGECGLDRSAAGRKQRGATPKANMCAPQARNEQQKRDEIRL